MMITTGTRNVLIGLGSVCVTAIVLANAFYQRKQFYPAIVYLTKSNASMAAIYFQGLTLVFWAWKTARFIFFGQLRPAEIEHLVDKSWFALTDTCLAFTVFRDDFSSSFVALFTILLFLKCFHWLAEDRIDFMERTPVISRLFHIRAVGLLVTLSFLDLFFVAYAYNSLVTKGVSFQLVFGFEYAILSTAVLLVGIKYILHCIDIANNQTQWDQKAAVLLYSELVINFCRVVLYATFLILMFKMQSFPLFAIRPIYMAIKSFKKSLFDVVMSRRAIHTMNTLFPNATPADIQAGDSTCIICREEMVTGCKKLPCNHIFHALCLRSWFQRQQTCPTCRLDILRPRAARRPGQAGAPGAAAGPAGGPNVQQIPHGGMFHPGQMPNGFMQPGGFQFPPFGFPQQFAFPGMAFPQPGQPVPPAAGAPGAGAPQPAPAPAAGAGAPPTGPFPHFHPHPAGMNLMMPPLFAMPPPPMPPMPVPTFGEMSDEELHRLEGDSRRALEMRVTHLRNIQTLLDAAVVQFSQYLSLMTPPTAPFPPPTAASAPPPASTSSTAAASFTAAVRPDVVAPPAEQGAGVAEAAAAGEDESDAVRRRRLDRFAAQV
ncbi:E3 ubiquitin-protein ligase synoviolin [Hypsibius exemplaris]|uniref:RING-type E3 ubiquitin transferase n=1 Tax=Hypsibius exemplaris TaxID=2072580 RepID=A0A1W0X8Z7_HYPEX|nr:E3 ubiquitin-protein ligase synoviolin [Hypsibius exemplaris]